MKPAEFVEACLNISLCDGVKIWVNKSYLLFKTDRHKFITLCNEAVGRGSSKTNIVYYLPIIFDRYQKEEE